MRSLLIFGSLTIAQAQAPHLQFEVASVKLSAPADMNRVISSAKNGPGRVVWRNMNLWSLIANAYQTQWIKGPDWLRGQVFDVTGNWPEGATEKDVPQMMQTLLAEQFHLQVHREERTGPTYALMVSKDGIKMKPAGPDLGRSVDAGFKAAGKTPTMHAGAMKMSLGPQKRLSANITMEALAGNLSSLLGSPVADETNTTEHYLIELEWSTEPDDSGAPSLFAALQQQLGLRLELKKALLATLVVDQVDKVPTENE